MAYDDERRFERLYREHFGRVAAYLLSRADRVVAEDALARTFEIAWRKIADVPDEPLPWLLGVARKVLAELRRAQGRRNALIERIAAGVEEAQDDHAETLVGRRRVLAALARLPDSQREALLLIVWEGLSQREAAVVLACSRGAVALRLHRARTRMRAALAEEASDDDEEAAPRAPVASPQSRSRNPSPAVIEEAT
jgi:RNA polymerase sigma-70 factor (ECF subfamily)